MEESFSNSVAHIGHPNNKLPRTMNPVPRHGLPVCVGMALAGKMDKKDYRVYTLWVTASWLKCSVWEGRNVRRKLQAGQPLCDREPQPSADLRKYRGCRETGQPGGEMGSVRMVFFPYRATIWTRSFMRIELAKHGKGKPRLLLQTQRRAVVLP